VSIIDTEMVATSFWIRDNTLPTAIIAAHDIGALGYFGDRDIIDMAGLIDPQVTPYIRDELKLSEYISSRNADFLMTFPSWYPHLVQGSTPFFCTVASYAPQAGGENMCLYPWPSVEP